MRDAENSTGPGVIHWKNRMKEREREAGMRPPSPAQWTQMNSETPEAVKNETRSMGLASWTQLSVQNVA